jgi:hypothetical protein
VLQVIEPKVVLLWTLSDLSVGTEGEMEEYLSQERRRTFDLTVAPLFRIHTFLLPSGSLRVVLLFHHIIMDGWSTSNLFDRLHDLYLNPYDHPPVEMAYLDSQEYLEKISGSRAQPSISTLDEEEVDLSGLCLRRPGEGRFNPSSIKTITDPRRLYLSLDVALVQALQSSARSQALTLNAILYFAWHKALSLYGGNKRTVVRTVLNGRSHPVPGIFESVGLYTDVVGIRFDHEGAQGESETVWEAVRRIQALLFAAEDVGSAPFSTSHFQPPYAFQNFPRVKPNGLGGTPVRDYTGYTDNMFSFLRFGKRRRA